MQASCSMTGEGPRACMPEQMPCAALTVPLSVQASCGTAVAGTKVLGWGEPSDNLAAAEWRKLGPGWQSSTDGPEGGTAVQDGWRIGWSGLVAAACLGVASLRSSTDAPVSIAFELWA